MSEMLDRRKVLEKAVDDCFREMYAKAQPMADFDNLVNEIKSGKIDEGEDGPIYKRHYLSQEEYSYIVNKYIEAYNIKSHWSEDIELLEEYLEKGGLKDKYIKEYTDKNGNWHPGYRGHTKVKPIKEQIGDYVSKSLQDRLSEKEQKKLVNKITSIVMGTIKDCKEFYRFDWEESSFRTTAALGCSPTSNMDTVKEWWKEHYNQDIEIEERNPLLFWDYEYYGDEMDEIMTEEYGENWKEVWDKKWKAKVAKKEKEREKIRKQFAKKLERSLKKAKEGNDGRV